MDTEIVIQVVDAPGAAGSPLAKAWVYWRQGGSTKLLRTDDTGRLFDLNPGADPTFPWLYTVTFTATPSTDVDLYYSRGAKPIPNPGLAENNPVFYKRKVPGAPTTGSSTASVAAGGLTNSIAPKPAAVIVLPNIRIQLTKPVELSLWPLLWDLHTDVYHTDGLNQGATLFSKGHLTVAENSASPAPNDAVRPKERGLAIEGSIDAAATGVRIRILDTTGNVVQLRQTAASSSGTNEIPGILQAAAGSMKPFTATVYFLATSAVLGPVQIFVLSDGMTPPIIEAFSVQLVGLQAVLVDDGVTNRTGQAAGPVQNESNETIVVDFRNSPQATAALLATQARARRMIAYQMFNRNRQLSRTNATVVLKPEMPLWMAEFHLLGLNKDRLQDLMVRRKHQFASAPTSLQFDLAWKLTASWDGPDSGTTSPRRYSYSQDFAQTQSFTFRLNASEQLDGVNAQGQVPNAITPSPRALDFPVTTRRVPTVFVTGQQRAWGRQAGAASADAVVAELQPRIVNGGNEILRGGDGVLQVATINIDLLRIDGGLLFSASPPGTAPPPPSDPDLRLPRFRIRGLNPPPPINALIDAMVQDYHDQHNTLPRITLLSLACWQQTVRLIFQHEAHTQQFEVGGSQRVSYAGQTYGLEQDMPLFGPPHGYGVGQLDDPPVTDDGAWSFIENIKAAVTLIMDIKATGAFGVVSPHMTTPNQRVRAVYQREIVRRYNGFAEFTWNGTDWVISPTLQQWANASNHAQGANPLLLYPNQVLGTGIVYSTGAGAGTKFPWPIAFTAAQYGPGT